ncbi:MAG: hypothetical protein NVSMB1_23420 [Polyangiales bacterium]
MRFALRLTALFIVFAFWATTDPSSATPLRSAHAKACPLSAVLIPSGTFPIGTASIQGFEQSEQPRRLVTLTRPYCLDRTEVTVAEYSACSTVSQCPEVKPAFSGARLPMTNVSWADARAACIFRGGRLPTEVEWEHAARGHDARR